MLKYKIETSLYLLHQCRHGGRGQMAAKSDNCITAYYSRDMWFGGHKAGRVTALPCGIIASTQGWKETVVLSRCVLQVGIPGILLEFSRAGTESVITSVRNLCSPKRLASLLGKVNALALHKVYSPNWDSSMPGITLGLTQSQQPHGRESRPCRAEAVLSCTVANLWVPDAPALSHQKPSGMYKLVPWLWFLLLFVTAKGRHVQLHSHLFSAGPIALEADGEATVLGSLFCKSCRVSWLHLLKRWDLSLDKGGRFPSPVTITVLKDIMGGSRERTES